MEIETITIGTVLKRLRLSMKFSQEELAARSSLDRTYISMLERNIKQPTITTVFLLANALNMKPSEFVQQLEEEFDGHTIKRTTI
ncbi:helix-turn-helix transcriptional regulator [Metasolibacillus meyeri]|uniref:Helix-turn-helix transcriptional regulator n=1 Tax=Metasolibacillus meyeri TaxID=1071052 RepID=A0AAW9NY89_9BACL|nr:helix-turn-helix transcriptional regulator [Metasolibacillus meyeri]MEC1179648.1 helix-turn-helix transcriptional regulator [Metasolibacillus meyeri]